MSRLERLPIFSEEAVGVEEFRAIYNVVKCVSFRTVRSSCRDSGPQSNITGRKRNRQGQTKNLASSSPSTNPTKVLNLICDTYESASQRDKKSWNVENEGNSNIASSTTPSQFLSAETTKGANIINCNNSDGYCSFVLQDNSENSVSTFTERIHNLVTKYYGANTECSGKNLLPHAILLTNAETIYDDDTVETADAETCAKSIAPLFTIAPHYWIFVGRNHHSGSGKWLSGRREHTDSIEHDGTFHHQLLGAKLWKLRPTLELREICDQQHDMALLDSYEILVEEGDVFVINTRLWWHQTEIPTGWSVSYARDLYLTMEKGSDERCSQSERTEIMEQEVVSNKEVSWASGFISKGTTLVVEDIIDDVIDDDEDISLRYDHLVPATIRRTALDSKANCKLVLLSIEEDNDFNDNAETETKLCNRKQLALETIRDIQEGEGFVMLLKEKKMS